MHTPLVVGAVLLLKTAGHSEPLSGLHWNDSTRRRLVVPFQFLIQSKTSRSHSEDLFKPRGFFHTNFHGREGRIVVLLLLFKTEKRTNILGGKTNHQVCSTNFTQLSPAVAAVIILNPKLTVITYVQSSLTTS